MPDRKILYYPTMLPSVEWLKWAVLYWDKVSPIIPDEIWAPGKFGVKEKPLFSSRNERRILRSVNYLEEKGIYEPTRPYRDSYASIKGRGKLRESHRNLLNELKGFLKSKDFMKNVRRDWVKDPLYRIHKGKFSDATINFLENEKLVFSESGKSELFR